MIVKKRVSWLRMLLSIRRSTLTRTMPRILVITAFSVVVTVAEIAFGIQTYSLTTIPFTLVGVVLGISLGFRNNAAYGRYWEARKLWGQLVNVTRSFARQATNLIVVPDSPEPPAPLHRQLLYEAIAYTHALRHHLRGSDPSEDLRPFLSGEELSGIAAQKNVPLYLLQCIAQRLRAAWQQGWIESYHLAVLENSLTQMTDVQGGCERIKNTPIPFAYTVLIHQIVAFYCFALPFGIVNEIGALTPVVVFLISHAFFGLDEIGDEIEDPFGTEPQHLPLSTLCCTIEVNLRQQLDESPLPELPTPVDDVLL